MKNIDYLKLYNLHKTNEIGSDIISNIQDYEIKFKINNEEAKTVEGRIREENIENGKHMLEKNHEEILEEANKFGCCLIKSNWSLIWFIKIMPLNIDWKIVFERWSLFVEKKYRKQWFWEVLVREILNKYKDMPLYSITNIQAVMKINDGFWQYKYLKSDLSNDILQVIESEWKLLDNDVIYWNEIFNILIKENAKVAVNI